MIENTDYQLVLPEDVDNEQAWDVRILTGLFAETVIRFGNIVADGITESSRFSFIVISSPDDELDETDEELQYVAGDILSSVLERGAQEGSLVLDERGD